MTTPPTSALRSDDAPSALPGTEPVPLSTGFGALAGEAGAVPHRAAPPVFDVCHVGVLLRALLFVHGVLGLGGAYAAADVGGWLLRLALAAAVALPAVLLWLVTVCLAQRRLDALPIPLQWLLVSGWGAACAASVWGLGRALQVGEPPGVMASVWTVAATGAAMAAALFLWLRQRAKLELPTATRARLAELQSRIRPHFLFNTLNTAIALVRVDPSRAEAVLEDLAELFRVALADSGPNAQSTLRDEIELARRYLAIEQLRFGERLQVRWEVDAAADGARLPPLLLQPLVENAVRHGIEPAPRGGVLRVRTRVRRGQVEILVANSVPPEVSLPGHGIALRNVHERLKLMHDVAADFSARRDGDVYRVQIVVPLA